MTEATRSKRIGSVGLDIVLCMVAWALGAVAAFLLSDLLLELLRGALEAGCTGAEAALRQTKRLAPGDAFACESVVVNGPVDALKIRGWLSASGGLALAFPVLAWQAMKGGMALLGRPRARIWPLALASSLLFWLGVGVAHGFVLPRALVTLLTLAPEVGMGFPLVDLTRRYALSTLVAGFSFQLPLVVWMILKGVGSRR